MYTLYHIVGVKFGLTKDFTRKNRQNQKRYGDDIVVSSKEYYTDETLATKLEQVYNKLYGYAFSSHRRNFPADPPE